MNAAYKVFSENVYKKAPMSEIAEECGISKALLFHDFSFPVLILVGDKDSTGKVKAYCKEWAKQTGYPLHFIKQAKHFSNGDNPEQVNKEKVLRKQKGLTQEQIAVVCAATQTQTCQSNEIRFISFSHKKAPKPNKA